MEGTAHRSIDEVDGKEKDRKSNNPGKADQVHALVFAEIFQSYGARTFTMIETND